MGNHANEHELIAYNNLPFRHRKIRCICEATDNRLRLLNEKQKQICNQIRNLGYENLNPTVRQEFKRLFVLAEHTKNSTRAEFIVIFGEKINTIRYRKEKQCESN